MEKKLSPFKSLQLVHKAMLAGQVVVLLAAIFIHQQQGEAFAPELNKTLQVLAIILGAVCVFAGSRLQSSRIQGLREASKGAAERIASYRTGAIIQWALTEAPAIFSLVCFIITGNYAFIALSAALILYFAIALNPSRTRMSILLQVREEEVE